MATATIIYTASDGTRFDTEVAAEKHDQQIRIVTAAMAPLGKCPQAVKDGKGWLQHAEKSVVASKTALCQLVAVELERAFPALAKACREKPMEVHPRSSVGRILDDCQGPLNDAWYRFACIDEKFREHQQPFFALNGPGSDHVCVEDRS